MRKIPFAGIELTSQRVRGYMVPLSYRGDVQFNKYTYIRYMNVLLHLSMDTVLLTTVRPNIGHGEVTHSSKYTIE